MASWAHLERVLVVPLSSPPAFIGRPSDSSNSVDGFSLVFWLFVFRFGHLEVLRCLSYFKWSRGVKLIVTGATSAFKGPNVILGLCKCNYSLTKGKELGAAAR